MAIFHDWKCYWWRGDECTCFDDDPDTCIEHGLE